MGRTKRVEFPDAIHHVTSRGNARQTIFLDSHDSLAFLHQVARTIETFGWLCHGYCLMPNHYHLLLQTPSPNLAEGMRALNCAFAQRFNDRYLRTGHVFGGRYRSKLVERDEHVLEANRYIVRNPCRAELCEHPEHWLWSSYASTAGDRGVEPFEVSDWILGFFDDTPTARASYARYVAAGRAEERRVLSPRDLAVHRVPMWWRRAPRRATSCTST